MTVFSFSLMDRVFTLQEVKTCVRDGSRRNSAHSHFGCPLKWNYISNPCVKEHFWSRGLHVTLFSPSAWLELEQRQQQLSKKRIQVQFQMPLKRERGRITTRPCWKHHILHPSSSYLYEELFVAARSQFQNQQLLIFYNSALFSTSGKATLVIPIFSEHI